MESDETTESSERKGAEGNGDSSGSDLIVDDDRERLRVDAAPKDCRLFAIQFDRRFRKSAAICDRSVRKDRTRT